MTVDTREKILQISARLFIRQGYTATSVNQIAKETGIGKATVYHHFPDKQAIVQALLERSAVRVQQALAEVKAEADPHRQIEAIAGASLRLRSESFDLFQVIRREVPGTREKLHAQLGSVLILYAAAVTNAIRDGVEQDVFRTVDPADAARTLLCMITGLYVQVYLSGGAFPDPEQALRSMLDIFFEGIDAH